MSWLSTRETKHGLDRYFIQKSVGKCDIIMQNCKLISGLGSNPARFLLNRATRVWCYKRVTTRSATRPLRCNCWKKPLQRFLSGTNSCNGSDRTVATARTPKDHYVLQTVPRSAINSAPLRGLQTHWKQHSFLSLWTDFDFLKEKSEKEIWSERRSTGNSKDSVINNCCMNLSLPKT